MRRVHQRLWDINHQHINFIQNRVKLKKDMHFPCEVLYYIVGDGAV
jgi:hypothetical protein